MPYQVLARKWRPQRFDDVVGQRPVAQTLRNAIGSGRLAHAFVFAGPRGVGKTTTARILARALNCATGPTADPCGRCDACVEIAEGRDIDVLEIDAATHTQVENVREVIIAGLSLAPVRDRYKIFLIDEVHQLSAHSFNALLKSIEEPPPHVVFMMATTELGKIPETIRSRSQVFELRPIAANAIAGQLRTIAAAEGLTVAEEALALIARAAEGSMRDAQSALDQVIAFAGETISADDVATVLGLVGRDLLLDAITAVADEDAPAAFALTGRAVEAGYDLRLVARELAGVVRDLLVLSVDPSRLDDPEIAPEGERERLRALAARFSREDLLRAFDVLARAEADLRDAAQPRYHLEMALLRWIHLRNLVPLAELIERLEVEQPAGGRAPSGPLDRRPSPPPGRPPAAPRRDAGARPGGGDPRPDPPLMEVAAPPAAPRERSQSPPASGDAAMKDALLAEIQREKAVFARMVVAQARRIDFDPDRVTFTFSPAQRALRDQLEQNRAWLEALVARVAGRKIEVVAVQTTGEAGGSGDTADSAAPDARSTRANALRAKALADTAVQAMLDVFPAEIRDVEEI